LTLSHRFFQSHFEEEFEMRKLVAGTLMMLLAFASQALAQSTNSSSRQSQSNQTSDQPGVGGVGNSATGDTSTSPASESAGSSASQATRRNSLGAGTQSANSQSGALEQHIATCLALGNEEEVAMAQFAQQRATNPEVKQFAQEMIRQHQQAIQQMQQAMPQLASMNLKLTSSASGQNGAASSRGETASAGNATAEADRSTATGETASSTTSAAGNQRGAAGGGQHQMVEFARTAKQNCLRLSEQSLGKKQGAEFDKAYIGQQIVAHTTMLAELQAAQQFASGSQLQPLIQQGTQMTEQHLAHAQSIMQQLEAAGSQGGAPARAGAPARSR
jgi:predicted outer membrane protein